MKGDVETFHEGGRWHNRIEGTGEALFGSAATKAEAQAAGRERAKELKVEHIVKGENGRIAERNSYGHDPRSVRG